MESLHDTFTRSLGTIAEKVVTLNEEVIKDLMREPVRQSQD